MVKQKMSWLIAMYPAVLSFGITFLRLMLAILVGRHCLLMDDWKVLGVYAIILITIFDILDGRFFKVSPLNDISFWRKIRRILDSVSDRICIQIVCISLVLINHDFLIPYIVICLKETLTACVCIREFKNGIIIYPFAISKFSTVFIALLAIAGITRSIFFMVVFSMFVAVSGVISHRKYRYKIRELKYGRLQEKIDFEYL